MSVHAQNEHSSEPKLSFNPAPHMSPVEPGGYLARILLDSPMDVERALLRAEALFEKGEVDNLEQPLVFVLHGPEVEIFFKQNYFRYKRIVDLAARLSAFEVVDMRVCETRMGVFGESKRVLPPFVGTVPFGPAEVERLIEKEEYVYF